MALPSGVSIPPVLATLDKITPHPQAAVFGPVASGLVIGERGQQRNPENWDTPLPPHWSIQVAP